MRILLAIAFASALCAQSTTLLSDTIKDSRGRLVNGLILLERDEFTAANGAHIGASRFFVPVVKGAFSVSLLPTDSGTPSGQVYTATYAIKGGYRRTSEAWHICTSTDPITIANAIGNTCSGGSLPPPLSWAAVTSVSWAALTSSAWAGMTN